MWNLNSGTLLFSNHVGRLWIARWGTSNSNKASEPCASKSCSACSKSLSQSVSAHMLDCRILAAVMLTRHISPHNCSELCQICEENTHPTSPCHHSWDYTHTWCIPSSVLHESWAVSQDTPQDTYMHVCLHACSNVAEMHVYTLITLMPCCQRKFWQGLCCHENQRLQSLCTGTICLCVNQFLRHVSFLFLFTVKH